MDAVIEGTMRKKTGTGSKKRNIKKKRRKIYSKKNGHDKSVNSQKVLDFKFPTLTKFYKNFSENRKKEKAKHEK